MTTISIKNWEQFQHYKDRDPPWVKLYRDLLTSESWVLGSDLSRVVQIASVLLAPRYGNKIPLRFGLLKKVMSLDCEEEQFNSAVQHLCDANFFEIQSDANTQIVSEQSASTPLASCTSETEQRRVDQSREETDTERVRASVSRGAKTPAEKVDNAFSDYESFQRVKDAYPKFSGRQDWIQAQNACMNLVAEDSTWQSLLGAVDRYARYIRAKGSEGTQYVLSPGKFFTAEDRPWLQAWDPPLNKAEVRQARNISAGQEWLAKQEARDAANGSR